MPSAEISPERSWQSHGMAENAWPLSHLFLCNECQLLYELISYIFSSYVDLLNWKVRNVTVTREHKNAQLSDL